MKRLICFVSVVFLVAACGERPTAVEEDTVGPQFKQVMTGTDLPLTGNSTFNAYLPRTQEWFYKDYTCPAEGELIFNERPGVEFGAGENVALDITEYGDCGGRNYIMYGTITPSGALRLNTPEFFVPIIMEHTGCTPSGTMPVYHGSFDGELLSTVTHFHGLCGEGTSWTDPNFPSDIPFPDGYVPVKMVAVSQAYVRHANRICRVHYRAPDPRMRARVRVHRCSGDRRRRRLPRQVFSRIAGAPGLHQVCTG